MAILALAGYELLIAVVAFAGKVFGDVQSRWAARAAGSLDVWLLQRTSRFERDYRIDLASRHRVDEPQGWFEEQSEAGRCVVLLDGLDEVAREEDRRRVAAWVEEQIEQYEGNDFVLTSRPHGYLSAPLNRARVL